MKVSHLVKKIIKFCIVISLVFFVVFLLEIKKDIRRLQRKHKSYKIFAKRVEEDAYVTLPLLGNVTLPLNLQNIPLADDSGIVLSTKKVNIRNVIAPYNASIIENGDGYLLFFRYDEMNVRSYISFFTSIGCVELDSNFNQTNKEFKRIDTNSKYSEDPRVLKVKDDIYLVYNDIASSKRLNHRFMRLAHLNLKDYKVDFVTNLETSISSIEKNWVPFEYIENDIPKIYFEYYLYPHKILKIDDPKKSFLTHLVFPSEATFQAIAWPKAWGKIRGGTTARKVGDQYLSFFHSSFEDSRGIAWYLLGAYTFEGKPPFRVTAISHYPILFEGIYDSPPLNTASPKKRVIFPCGFVEENRGGRELIHISCGENDAAVKIVTIDKKALFKSLKKL